MMSLSPSGNGRKHNITFVNYGEAETMSYNSDTSGRRYGEGDVRTCRLFLSERES